MPNVAITADEQTLLVNALDKEIASMKRQQNTAKAPAFAQVAREHEATLQELKAKLIKQK